MIFLTDLRSIIEGAYLEIPISNKYKETHILVNPTKITYLSDRTIIINDPRYPIQDIQKLIINGNRVISRIKFQGAPKALIQQEYLPRLNHGIMWNGAITDSLSEDNYEDLEYFFDGKILYFPKPNKINLDLINISSLGYLIYQIGYNIYTETAFQDLDIIKIQKGFF